MFLVNFYNIILKARETLEKFEGKHIVYLGISFPVSILNQATILPHSQLAVPKIKEKREERKMR